MTGYPSGPHDQVLGRIMQALEEQGAERVQKLAARWGVRPSTIYKWSLDGNKQLRVLMHGVAAREKMPSRDPRKSQRTAVNLSVFVQRHGIFIKDVVELSGLTRQTLNRLALRRRGTDRLRDLVAGVEATLAAAPRQGDAHTDDGE